MWYVEKIFTTEDLEKLPRAGFSVSNNGAGNGAVLESGTCVLPDAIAGLPYAGHLLTSHQAGGTLSVITGSLPPA